MSEILKTPAEYGYIIKNGICLFKKGPLSQWYGGFSGQSSNFKSSKDYNKSLTFNCCEQWMMAHKAIEFKDEAIFNEIMSEKNAAKHRSLGRKITGFVPAAWDAVKYNIVLMGNICKFQQNDHLAKFLLQFPIDTIFAESVNFDLVWGTGIDIAEPNAIFVDTWHGQNLLGKAISEVRKLL